MSRTAKNNPIAELSVAQLMALADIQKERQKLIQKIEELDFKVEAIVGQPGGPKRPGPPPHVILPRGAKKEAIVTHLRAAGPRGMSVLELAAATGFTRKDIDRYVFSPTLLRVQGFRKLGPARYGITALKGPSRGIRPIKNGRKKAVG